MKVPTRDGCGKCARTRSPALPAPASRARRHSRDRPGLGVVEGGDHSRVEFVPLVAADLRPPAWLEKDCEIRDVVVKATFDRDREVRVQAAVLFREPIGAWGGITPKGDEQADGSGGEPGEFESTIWPRLLPQVTRGLPAATVSFRPSGTAFPSEHTKRPARVRPGET